MTSKPGKSDIFPGSDHITGKPSTLLTISGTHKNLNVKLYISWQEAAKLALPAKRLYT